MDPKDDISMEEVLKEASEPCGIQCGNAKQEIAGPDREAWVRNQVFAAIRMALALKDHTEVRAEHTAYIHGVQGIADGCTIEILRTLGFSVRACDLVNLPRETPIAWHKINR